MNTPKYLATGLRLGLVDATEVQCWVNEQIINQEVPSDAMLSLAYTKAEDIHGLYNILNELAGDADEFESVRLLLADIEPVKLESIEFCRHLAKCLFFIWADHGYTAPDDLNEIGFLEDEYVMAQNGTFGTVGEWHVNFKDFIGNVRTNTTESQ